MIVPYLYTSKEVVHVCTWYDLLPDEVIEQFEKETGIKVICDLFDSNDVLETKLLTENPGYDIVTPSAMPYLSRGIELDLFEKLDKTQLSNLKNVDERIYTKMKHLKDYGVLYGFGTFGLLYNKDFISKHFPEGVKSYSAIFDFKNIKKIASFGIALGDEAQDVISSVLTFLETDDIQKAYKLLENIRPYIKYFNIARHANDLVMREIVISLTPNHEAVRAVFKSKQLEFFIPESEKSFWCDTLAIPKKAPNLRNAYKFMNFLLREDIAVKITNETFLPNSVSFKYHQKVNDQIKKNKQLFLDNIDQYSLHKPKTLEDYRSISENWMRIIMGKKL